MSLMYRARRSARPNRVFALAFAAFLVLPGAGRARAEDVASVETEPAFVVAGGVYALVRAYDYPYYVGAEYLARPRTRWLLTPSVGLSFGREGIAYLRLGVERDFRLGEHWYFTPSLAGGYFINGDYVGVLDHLEFQSGVAFSRRLRNGMRWGLAGYHVSNAGLERPNNGTEALVLFLRVPIRSAGAGD